MRISLLIEERRLEDALRALRSHGFTPDPDEPPVTDPARPKVFTVAGEAPERIIARLPGIAGVLDWTIAPLADPKPTPTRWPWSQQPETD